jgi:excisionase family DNA binding protein
MENIGMVSASLAQAVAELLAPPQELFQDTQAYRPGEVAFRLGISQSFLYRLMSSNRLTYMKVGRTRLIPGASANKLARESLQGVES